MLQDFRYTVYWSLRAYELEHDGIHETAHNVTNINGQSARLQDLDTCEDIFVRVQVTSPSEGPLSDMTSARTDSGKEFYYMYKNAFQ